jgi:hypothetical protein
VTTILAIDPGPVRSGWVLFDGVRVLQSGDYDNPTILMAVYSRACGTADMLALEEPEGMGQIASTALLRAAWQGGILEAKWPGLRAMRITRRRVLAHLLRGPKPPGKSNDSRVRAALIDLVGPQGTKAHPGPTYGVSGDAWAALAVAVTALDEMRAQDPPRMRGVGTANTACIATRCVA